MAVIVDGDRARLEVGAWFGLGAGWREVGSNPQILLFCCRDSPLGLVFGVCFIEVDEAGYLATVHALLFPFNLEE